MVPEIAHHHRGLKLTTNGVCEQYLPTVGKAHHTAGTVDVNPNVGVILDCGRALVQPHPNAHHLSSWPPVRRQSPLRTGCALDCGGDGLKRNEERVTRSADLIAPGRVDRF